MVLHKLLQRQLNRLNLSRDSLPEDTEIWQLFIDRINNVYNDSDQERYLVNRSMEISSRELHDLNAQLISSARRAGMADVATSILHNIGNVLNSTNVSISLLKEKLETQNIIKLIQTVKLITDNLSANPEYFRSDPKGKLVLDYLQSLVKVIEDEQTQFSNELINLHQNIQHIREIVSMQRSISGIMGVTEEVFISDVIEATLQMAGAPFEKHGITIHKNFENVGKVLIDKGKLIQICTNLIQNAKSALIEDVSNDNKKIEIEIRKTDKNEIAISVKDNGIGIAPENVSKLFTFGFTTKKDGHGFGLHSAALAAKDIKGVLRAHSAGIGQGATFVLTIQTES